MHTEDSDVYVTGTVFAVNRGVLGSRVSVAEGSVAVKARRGDTTLAAGEQYAASRFVAAEPVEQDFAWSANATQHLALLNEFAKVKNQWQKLQLPELRYDSTLLRQMPAGTVFFAALPNLGPTVEQAWGVFQNQMSQSAVLKQWWEQEQPTPSGRSLEDAVRQIKTFHEYLGKEVVFAAMNGPDGRKQFALIADVTKSGLDSYIKSQLPAGSPAPEYAIVNNTIVLGLEGTSVSAWAAWAGRLRTRACQLRSRPAIDEQLPPRHKHHCGARHRGCASVERSCGPAIGRHALLRGRTPHTATAQRPRRRNEGGSHLQRNP